ncbi:FAD-dependent oxidoreductase [Jonesiaceae bacterium BS-20]|uniref:FAD-dependent oxidoreductase n=1 Tax=Jonesiaceae bacterium BS-20 TaxID=3120821 RepID=A0AAU7DVF5_9MICO
METHESFDNKPVVDTPERVVIIGGGLAGAKTAQALRDKGFAGGITIVVAEQHLPYERPLLSKEYLTGRKPFEKALVLPEAWYDEHAVSLVRGVEATAVDRIGSRVLLADGRSLPYTKLVLAMGAKARVLTVAGAKAQGVFTLRTKEDADQIRSAFGSDKRLVVVGGGWIGLEVASAARELGAAVTVLERGDLPLMGVLGREIAQVFADLHTNHGVRLRSNVRVDRVEEREGHVTGVRLATGEVIGADAVVVGIGAAPQVHLAQLAGLTVDNGVVVNASLQTSDSNIFAVGDIANHEHPVLKRRVRVEHWATALSQPQTVADAITGAAASYDKIPYFYSDQFELSMEYGGYVPRDSYDRVVVRGDLDALEFVAFWVCGNKVLAGMNVNVWDVNKEIRNLVASGRDVDLGALSDPLIPLESL